MTPVVNAVTGAVTAEIDGQTFTFQATLSRLAAFQAALGVPGLAMTEAMIAAVDPRALAAGLAHLLVSGPAGHFDDRPIVPHASALSAALMAALTAGLPEPSGKDDTAPKH